MTGLSSSKAVGRILMVMQAFIDESYDRNGVCVLAGYLASAETWAHFSKERDELLPVFGTRAKNGKFRFELLPVSWTPR